MPPSSRAVLARPAAALGEQRLVPVLSRAGVRAATVTTQKASAAPEPAAMPEAVATPKHVTTPQPVMTPETVAAWSSAAKAEQEQPADRRRRRTGWSLPRRSSRSEDQGRCLAMPAIRQEQVRERRFRRSRERRFRQSDTTAAVRCSRSTRPRARRRQTQPPPRRTRRDADPRDADPSASRPL